VSCGAILYFDHETEAAIRGLWQAVEDAGLPSPMLELNFPPHMTLMVCQEMDLDQLRLAIKEYIATHPPLPVSFPGVGFFAGPTPVIYLSVAVNRALLDMHANYWRVASPHNRGESEFYRPGLWTPHVTLSHGPLDEHTAKVVDTLLKANIPKYGLLRDLVIAEFSPNQEKEPKGLTEHFKSRLGRYL
jgi:2'-5' RNA ligase